MLSTTTQSEYEVPERPKEFVALTSIVPLKSALTGERVSQLNSKRPVALLTSLALIWRMRTSRASAR